MDNQPVVAFVGQQGLNALGTFGQQVSNLEWALADVAVYVQTIVSPEQVRAVVDTAFRNARLRLGPAVVPPHSEILKVVGIINADSKVSFLVGQGANGATANLSWQDGEPAPGLSRAR